MIRTIAGRQNASIKLARKLQKKKDRRERGLFVAEGLDLIDAAHQAGEDPTELLVREDLAAKVPRDLWRRAQAGDFDIGLCSPDTLAEASSLGGAADFVGIYPLPEWSLGDLDLAGRVSVYLYRVGDPGNVGTIVRAAVSFGASAVILSPAGADAFSPKALRGGMGAQFVLPVVEEVTPSDLEARLQAERRRGAPVPELLLADPHKGMDPRTFSSRREPAGGQDGRAKGAGWAGRGVILVLGAERGALPEFSLPSERVRIKHPGFESLNVAMAATILLYELS